METLSPFGSFAKEQPRFPKKAMVPDVVREARETADGGVRRIVLIGNYVPRRWLIIYHGVRQTASGSLYRLGLALFDSRTPERCILRGDTWVFGPEEPYERQGDVANVVFPCGHTLAPDGDTLTLYYGAADTCVAIATASMRVLLEWLDHRGRPDCNASTLW